MSNVLIGIIGVILFIGLALAGALILGDDFKSANSEAKAAAAMSILQQTSHAANMYKLKTGLQVYSVDTEFLVPRFLAAPARNPLSPNPSWKTTVHFNAVPSNSSAAVPTQIAEYVQLRSTDSNGEAICGIINNYTDSSDTLGCNVFSNGVIIAWQKL